MIQFTLKCDNDHQFDSWFQSSEAFDKLQSAGLVVCAVCGSKHVKKAMMAPRVQNSSTRTAPPSDPEQPSAPLSTPQNPAERALADMRRSLEENSEYVGLKFAQEARAIHGEAGPEEAKALIEEGVPVTPLPFIPGRKTN